MRKDQARVGEWETREGRRGHFIEPGWILQDRAVSSSSNSSSSECTLLHPRSLRQSVGGRQVCELCQRETKRAREGEKERERPRARVREGGEGGSGGRGIEKWGRCDSDMSDWNGLSTKQE
eukprot:1064376-Rhodomonas_salina.1